jgi:1,4-dihydroxy-2-naphthoate octaprenyltransferase
VSIAAGVLYTGGPRPYGYEGLGELFVFVFFGLVAVGGSYFVQVEDLRWEAVALGVPVGLLAAAILVVNNVRDVETDRRAGKRTLAVRLGRERAVGVFAAMLVLAFASVPVIAALGDLEAWVLLALLSLPLAFPLGRTLARRRDGPSLNKLLADTGRLLAVFSLLLAAGLLLAS